EPAAGARSEDILTRSWQGRSNLQAMRWDEIDWDRAQWRIPDTKSNDMQIVPMCAVAIEILKSRRTAADGSPRVFPSHGKTGHLISQLKTWERMCKRNLLRKR
ncbi:MAG: hypothetical protein ACC628_04210, partial [Pirellulaceae bacterium]